MAQSAEKQRAGKRSSPGLVTNTEQNGRADHGSGAQHMMDLDFLRGLIDAVDQSGIDSIEINRAGTRIRIAKTPAAAATLPAFAPSSLPQHAPTHAPPAATTAATPTPAEAPSAKPTASNLIDVTSPMVGTFYRAPAPDAPPYVEVGSTIAKGQTLCILEAMKLMNELPSELDGIVREILVEDADPVEYGQVLFRILPNSK